MLIAITGNFGSGKSTLLGFFKRQGYKIYDSDKMVFGLYRQKKVIAKLKKIFGSKIEKKHGIKKSELAKIVFKDKKKLWALNKIIHPLIIREIKKIKHKGIIVFVEVPLLFEAKMEKLFTKVILVIASKKNCVRRIRKKGFRKEDFENRTKFQFKAKNIRKKSDYVIINNSSMRKFLIRAKNIMRKLGA